MVNRKKYCDADEKINLKGRFQLLHFFAIPYSGIVKANFAYAITKCIARVVLKLSEALSFCH